MSGTPADSALPINRHCKRNGFLLNLSSGMQTIIQVIATGTGSLRNKIMSDPQLEKKFGFIKVWHKQPSRPHGWAKIHSARDVHGAINLEWHARSETLICRIVAQSLVIYRLSACTASKLYPRHSHQRRTLEKTGAFCPASLRASCCERNSRYRHCEGQQ